MPNNDISVYLNKYLINWLGCLFCGDLKLPCYKKHVVDSFYCISPHQYEMSAPGGIVVSTLITRKRKEAKLMRWWASSLHHKWMPGDRMSDTKDHSIRTMPGYPTIEPTGPSWSSFWYRLWCFHDKFLKSLIMFNSSHVLINHKAYSFFSLPGLAVIGSTMPSW